MWQRILTGRFPGTRLQQEMRLEEKKSPWELNSRVKSFIRMKYLVSQQQLCLMKQVPPFCRISLKGKFNITLVCVCVCSLCGTTGLLFFSFFCTSKDQNLLNWLQKWNIYEVFQRNKSRCYKSTVFLNKLLHACRKKEKKNYFLRRPSLMCQIRKHFCPN